MSIELEKPLLVDQKAVLYAGHWGAEPARIWMIDPAGAGPAAMEAAQRDLECLAALDAPDLLPITASGILDDGRLWAAVPPETDLGLHELLAELGPMRLPQLRSLARALCSALAALHQQGLVHGGIAPSMMRYSSIDDDSASPRLAGAGWASLRLAWLARSDPDPELLRRMAPELRSGQAAITDRQADIFAVGCLLFEAATGAAAFAGDTLAEVDAALNSSDRPDVRATLGPAEEPLARVLGRCLARSPKKRFTSVTALWRELAPALGGGSAPLRMHHTAPAGLPAETPPAGGVSARADGATTARPTDRRLEGGARAPLPTTSAPVDSRRRRGLLLTMAITLAAAGAAAGILLLLRGAAPPSRQRDEPPPVTISSPGDGAALLASHPRKSMRRRAGVPRRVAVRAGARRIDRLLARVGLTGGEVIVDSALAVDYDLAVQALHDGKPEDLADALEQIARATLPSRCEAIRKKKRFYIKSGLRTLGKRLGHWERFRIERRLADVLKSPGDCRARSRRLSPLVEEIRDRLADVHTR